MAINGNIKKWVENNFTLPSVMYIHVFSNPVVIYLTSGRVGRVTSIIVVSKCQLIVQHLYWWDVFAIWIENPLLNFNKMDVAYALHCNNTVSLNTFLGQ